MSCPGVESLTCINMYSYFEKYFPLWMRCAIRRNADGTGHHPHRQRRRPWRVPARVVEMLDPWRSPYDCPVTTRLSHVSIRIEPTGLLGNNIC